MRRSRGSRPPPTLEALADCDLVIEAIVEELEPKRALFAELDRICRPDAILATNTSALSVTEIAAATTRPERVVGMHFFNPAPLMPLVEIVQAELTSRRDGRGCGRRRRSPRQGSRSLPRHARVRRQPGPDPASERLPARARRGTRDTRGARRGDEERRRLADGPVHARRPGRHRRPRPRVRGALREAPRAADGTAAAARRDEERGLLGRKSGRGFYTYE